MRVSNSLDGYYTYRPAGESKGLLVVHHGTSGTGEPTRDQAIQIANEKGYAVISPRLDHLASADYQMGGVTSSSSPDSWTVFLETKFVEWGTAQAGLDANDPVVLFGHSGGGQWVSRVAAYAPDDSLFDNIIVANPSTHVLASMTEKAAYGFGGFSAAQGEAMLKDYLADPVTIYLGSEDNDPNAADLSTGSSAMRQGDDRLERGLNTFSKAKQLAASKGWEFNWELVIADGVGHTSGGMLRAPEMRDAIDTLADNPSSTPTKYGTSSGNTLSGTFGANVIDGLAGGDRLYSRAGNDILIGGSGNDAFTFDTALNATTNVDTIMDFNVDGDTIRLSDMIFSNLSEGSLRSSNFRVGDKALDSNDYIVYTESTGALYYDKDGSGSAAAVKFAEIDNKALLTAANFIVI
ncbi:M10 family metallopeptidase C-terminal domain-containing protein [Microvirga sp. P5_D2]